VGCGRPCRFRLHCDTTATSFAVTVNAIVNASNELFSITATTSNHQLFQASSRLPLDIFPHTGTCQAGAATACTTRAWRCAAPPTTTGLSAPGEWLPLECMQGVLPSPPVTPPSFISPPLAFPHPLHPHPISSLHHPLHPPHAC